MRTVLEPSSSSSSVVGRDIYSSAKERTPSCDDALSSFFPPPVIKSERCTLKRRRRRRRGMVGQCTIASTRRRPGIQTGGTRRRRVGRVRRQGENPGTLLSGDACLPALSDVPPRHARPRGSKIHPIFLAFRRPPRRAHPRGAMIVPSCWGYLRIARSHPTMLLGLCISPLLVGFSRESKEEKFVPLSLSRRWISSCIFQLVMNVASYYHYITVDQRKEM